jgi:hypothetical protein
MRDSKPLEQIHESMNVVLSKTIEHVEPTVGILDLAIPDKSIDKRNLSWPLDEKNVISKEEAGTIWIEPQEMFYHLHFWL